MSMDEGSLRPAAAEVMLQRMHRDRTGELGSRVGDGSRACTPGEGEALAWWGERLEPTLGIEPWTPTLRVAGFA